MADPYWDGFYRDLGVAKPAEPAVRNGYDAMFDSAKQLRDKQIDLLSQNDWFRGSRGIPLVSDPVTNVQRTPLSVASMVAEASGSRPATASRDISLARYNGFNGGNVALNTAAPRLGDEFPQATQQIALASPPAANPGMTPWDAMTVAENMRGRAPWSWMSPPAQAAPTAIAQTDWTRANQGMGGLTGAMRMASSIPAQQPYTGGQPYNPTAVATALSTSRGGTGVSTNGYVYDNGRKVGVAPWAAGMSPADQTAAAEVQGLMAAQQRQANATGTAGGFQYVNGKNVGADPRYADVRVGDRAGVIEREAAQRARDNSKDPDKANARASLASIYGFD